MKRYIEVMLAILFWNLGMAGVITREMKFQDDGLQIQAFVDENGETYSDVVWDDFVLEPTADGKLLPVKYVTIQVPSWSKDFKVTLENVKWGRTVNLPYPLMPVRHIALSGTQDAKDTATTTALSGTDSSSDNVGIANHYFLNWSDHYVVIRLACASMHSDSSLVPMNSATIRLTYNECKLEDMGFDMDIPQSSPASIEDKQRAAATSVPATDYLIITTDALREACQQLVTWKAQKGLNVRLFTIEEVQHTSSLIPGVSTGIVDMAESLRRFLQSVCNTNKETYCMMIGPSDKIPIRYFYESNTYLEKWDKENVLGGSFIPSDMYYSDLTKEWVLSKDHGGIYTIDTSTVTSFSPTIYVGRLLCADKWELANYMHKLLIYEAYPGKGDDAYLDNGLVFKQRFCRTQNDLVTSLGTLQDPVRIVDNGGSTYEENKPMGRDIINLMGNKGIVSFQGHGMPGGIAACGENKKYSTWHYIKALEDYTVEDLGWFDPTENEYAKPEYQNGLDLLNNTYKPFMAYSMSCDIMPFDLYRGIDIPYNVGTSLTVAGLYGSVALIGNTRSGYTNASDYIEKSFASEIKYNCQIGKAHSRSKIDKSYSTSVTRFCCISCNLLGDPEVAMWLRKPLTQDVKVYISGNSFIAEGTSLLSSTIALYDGVHSPVIVKPTSSTSYSTNLSSLGIDTEFFTRSVWRPGYLPYIDLTEQNANLYNSTKRFIVHNATFGATVIPTKVPGQCVIGTNGRLEVTALQSINAYKGFVLAGGSGEFKCMGDIRMSGVRIEPYSTLILEGETVILSDDFTTTANCELVINGK